MRECGVRVVLSVSSGRMDRITTVYKEHCAGEEKAARRLRG